MRSRLLVSTERIVQDVNRFLRGWAGYFRYGNVAREFSKLRAYAGLRLMLWWGSVPRAVNDTAGDDAGSIAHSPSRIAWACSRSMDGSSHRGRTGRGG